MTDLGSPLRKRSRSRVVQYLLAGGFALGLSGLGALVGDLARRPPLVPLGGTPLALGATEAGLKHDWRLKLGRHWQIASTPSESQETTDTAEGTRGACGVGMVEVKGRQKMDPSANHFSSNTVEEMQKTTCTKWLQREYPERCAEFDRAKWLELSKELPTKEQHFCIDRFEYPNQKGVFPWIMVSWYEAEDLCADEGKRLCNEDEWTFACEGEEATPYPYGYTRDATACVIDRTWRPYHESGFRPRDGANASAELDRLWQGVPSGSQPRCRSPFGVYDLTGNVDEWTRTVREGERPSILKGGYWGPVRTRCRPATRSHDENHIFYQQGVRCCAEVGAQLQHHPHADEPSRVPLPPPVQ
jgi:formylglycine-generating enzyme